MGKLFEEKVVLEPIHHIYTHNDGRNFDSLSRVRDCIKTPFDKSIARNCAGKGEYVGMTAEQVLVAWEKKANKAADHGTNIHDAIERFEKSAVILAQDEWLRPMILCLTNEYKDMYQVHNEVCLYDEEYEIAGTADHIIETTKHKSSVLNIDDFKTNLNKGINFENKYKKYLLGPFSHVQDCNYYDYSLQLSCYAYMLEKLTSRKIGHLSIIFIPPQNPLAYKRIPVNYAKNDAKILFNYYKELKHIKKEEGITSDNSAQQLIPNFA